MPRPAMMPPLSPDGFMRSLHHRRDPIRRLGETTAQLVMFAIRRGVMDPISVAAASVSKTARAVAQRMVDVAGVDYRLRTTSARVARWR